MARYKCLNNDYTNYKKGEIYDGDIASRPSEETPKSLSEEYPNEWELVEDDEIIGYKLKEDCKQYKEAVETIARNIVYRGSEYDFQNTNNIRRLREAKVLDLWFEPVYAPKFSLPKIKGYEGKIGQGTSSETFKSNQTVEYGCATLNVQWLRNIVKLEKANGCSGVGNRELNSITLDSGVTIRVEQMKQIVEYFDNI